MGSGVSTSSKEKFYKLANEELQLPADFNTQIAAVQKTLDDCNISGDRRAELLQSLAETVDRPRPSSSWPREYAFKLTKGAHATLYSSLKEDWGATTDSDDNQVIAAAQNGFKYLIDHYETLRDEGLLFEDLDVSAHPLLEGILSETVRVRAVDNDDGTKDVLYISLHTCDLRFEQLMDVYWDSRVTMDVAARSYLGAKLLCEEGSKKLVQSLYPKKAAGEDGVDRFDVLTFGDKIAYKDGELAMAFACESPAAPRSTFVERVQSSHCSASGMFPGTKEGTADVYCTGHVTVAAEVDLYHGIIEPMAIAVMQQVKYGKAHSKR